LASAERLELPFEAGLGHYELGRHTDEGGEDRWRHLEEAVRLFESLGTPHELRLAAGALDRSVH
jgi:hypothetical protein